MSASLLALLQLSDSGFPSGAFAHSYGLEQALNEKLIARADEIEAFVRSVILQSAATADARACFAATVAARDGDRAALVAMDQSLFRTKAASELREACVQTGRRLLAETVIHIEVPSCLTEPAHPASSKFDAASNFAPSPSTERGKLAKRAGSEVAAPLLHAYADAVKQGQAPGCYPVAFGTVAAVLGVEPAGASSALLLSTATALLQAAMRLGRISHRDAQAVLHRLRPEISQRVIEIRVAPLTLSFSLEREGIWPTTLQSYHPLQEVASMRHQRAEARLFAS